MSEAPLQRAGGKGEGEGGGGARDKENARARKRTRERARECHKKRGNESEKDTGVPRPHESDLPPRIPTELEAEPYCMVLGGRCFL